MRLTGLPDPDPALPRERGREQWSVLALIGVSLAGAADVAEFLATRSAMFADAPGRAAGSIAGIVLWLGLLAVATLRYVRGERTGSRAVTVGLAALVAAGNVGLTAVHLKAGVGGLRPAVGGVLGILALILALTSRAPVAEATPRRLR